MMDLEHPDITKIRERGHPDTKPKSELISNQNAISWDPIKWIKEGKQKTPR